MKEGPAISIFSMSGNTIHKKRLRDIFSDDEYKRFETGTFGIDWFRDAWIDEVSKELVIVSAEDVKKSGISFGLSNEHRVRVMDLKTGKFRVGGKNDVIRALETRNPTHLRRIIILAAELRIKAALPILNDIARCSSDREIRKLAKSALDVISKPN